MTPLTGIKAPCSLLATLLWLAACSSPKEPPVTPSPNGVPCVNLPADHVNLLEANAPAHPLIVQGVTSALLPEQSSLLDSLFFSKAYAFALEQETAIEGARIELFEIPRGPIPEELPPPLLSTTSDRQGRYCLVLPHPPDEGALFLLVANPKQTELPSMRQVITHSFDADLNAMSEAITRTLSPHLSSPALTNARILNARTLSETRLGLLSPDLLDGIATQEALIARATERLRHDVTLQSALAPTP